MNAEVAWIRLRSSTRTLLRLVGLLAVLAGAYHLFLPILADVPTWAPWRTGAVVGVENGLIFFGDVLVMAVGAIVVWFF